jgi:type IV pilus assembly protein PilZ
MTDKEELLTCVFHNESALYLAYMPFINDGGLFVRTKNLYEMGERVTLSLGFLEETERHRVESEVVWITPKGAQGNKPSGIGVQFTSDNKHQICNKIETLLAGKLKSTQSTDTM